MPVVLLLQGCMNDDELWEPEGEMPLSTGGLFIVNEGNFTYGNASLSFYDIEHKIFSMELTDFLWEMWLILWPSGTAWVMW